MERDAFMTRVREGVRTAVIPPHPDLDPGVLVPDLAEADLVGLFTSRLEAVDAEWHRVPVAEAASTVAGIAAGHDAAGFMAWDAERLPAPGVADGLVGAGLRRVSGLLDDSARRDQQLGYLDLDLGVTAAEAGFAESGTIVLRSGEGRPRMASVIPLIHVALLPVDRIHRSLSHWAARHAAGIAHAANLVFITGPSRTADIEQNINVGVHGPRHVHVVILDP